MIFGVGFFMVSQPAPLQTLSGWEEFSAHPVGIQALLRAGAAWSGGGEPSVELGAEDPGLNPGAASSPL